MLLPCCGGRSLDISKGRGELGHGGICFDGMSRYRQQYR